MSTGTGMSGGKLHIVDVVKSVMEFIHCSISVKSIHFFYT